MSPTTSPPTGSPSWRQTNHEQFDKMKIGRGFIAALDQSGGSTPKALRAYGIDEDRYSDDDEMFALMHAMRSRIIESSSFDGDDIIGTIVFEDTMDRDWMEMTWLLAHEHEDILREVLSLLAARRQKWIINGGEDAILSTGTASAGLGGDDEESAL